MEIKKINKEIDDEVIGEMRYEITKFGEHIAKTLVIQ